MFAAEHNLIVLNKLFRLPARMVSVICYFVDNWVDIHSFCSENRISFVVSMINIRMLMDGLYLLDIFSDFNTENIKEVITCKLNLIFFHFVR